MYEPEHIQARFEIVTPMFLGGADRESGAIRPQSIKGELAFWWRALHFARYVGKTGSMRNALDAMHADELILFGGDKRQGLFLLSVTAANIARFPKSPAGNHDQTLKNANGRPVGPGTCYLGYGLMGAFGDTQGKLVRSCLEAGGTFDLRIIFRKRKHGSAGDDSADSGRHGELRSDLVRTIKVMGLMGGLGSRKRRGWGSLALRKLEGRGGIEATFDPPNSAESFKEMLSGLIDPPGVSGTQFPLSAFASETELRVWNPAGWSDTPKSDGSGQFEHCTDALEATGKAFQLYRSWGRDGQVLGQPRRENFKPDHDWFKSGSAGWNSRNGHGPAGDALPERANFGLPHNYFGDDNAGRRGKLNIDPTGGTDRRGSPLFFHIHAVGGRYLPVAIFFDNIFLPDPGLRLIDTTGKKARTITDNAPFTPDAQVVRDFLDGAARPTSNGEKNQAPFATCKVLPGKGGKVLPGKGGTP
ncbi:MAG: type III-B CRISPR module RAMP protein Cmr1 [Rhizobiaceae bacterium]|nr:type III-B CRISPR module RAMP protein Cmr1 [Rhizobiaceae bacterium]